MQAAGWSTAQIQARPGSVVRPVGHSDRPHLGPHVCRGHPAGPSHRCQGTAKVIRPVPAADLKRSGSLLTRFVRLELGFHLLIPMMPIEQLIADVGNVLLNVFSRNS